MEVGRLKTKMQRIDVVDRPRVIGIGLDIFYPDYTGLSPLTIDEDNGSFSAVVGSRVNMKIETNLPVKSAALVFEDSSRTVLAVEDRVSRGSLLVEKSRSYYIRLLDHLGEENPDPIEYYITAIPDEFPTIDVIRPGFDVNLNDEMVLPLKVRIFDDYGFSSLVLKYTVVSQGRPSEEHVAVLHFSDRIKTEGDVEFNWDMEPLYLFPGDYLTYYFEVADNDLISGPKVSRSRQYVARLPSLDELVAQTEAESQQRIFKTEDLIRSGRETVQRLKNVVRKLEARNANTPKADWQDQKELQSIAEKNEEMLQRIEKMAEEMESALERTQENALLSREIMEKLAQIQKLFEEVATPEMKEAQRRLMEALQRMDREQLEQAAKDFQVSQEEMLERLERTLALLKRLQLEQKMEAMIRKAEQIAERQQGMNEKTAAADRTSLPPMSKSENEIKQSLERLKAEVNELRQMMNEAKMEASPEAQKFAEAVEKTDAGRDMQAMSESLQQQKKEAAAKQGKTAYTKLMDMLDEMQKQFASLTEDDSEQIKKAIRRAIDDANYLSQGQEELIRKAAAMDPRSLVLREVAVSQQDLSSACSGLKNSIVELGKQSPFIAAELQSLLNRAVANMGLAVQEFENRRGTAATRNQREAMVDLNKAALRLMESLDQQKKCENAKNCNQGIAKLEKLCNKQNQLNRQCQNQCNNPKPGPGKQANAAREALQRLAAEQGTIRKSLEQLQREFGSSRHILGRLDDIAHEMKEVEENLADGEVGEETTQRQLRIYSRMLEAARSLQRKDFSDQRRATTAEEQPVYIPPSLPANLLNDRLQLEDRLRDYLGTGYPSQYEEQIKAYFRALLKTEAQRHEQSGSGVEQ